MKKKNIFKFLSVALLCTSFISSTKAMTASINTSYGVNFRSTPTSNEENIIASLKYNTKITIDDVTKYTGTGCDKGWYKAKYNDKSGYVCSEYVTINNTTTGLGTYYTTSAYDARVSGTLVNIRKKASTSSSAVALLMYGENLKIVSSSSSGNGCSKNWYQVSFQDSKTGYICGTYLKKYSDVTDTTETEKNVEYCNDLVASGFPKSYCPYLIKLHSEHPTWSFTPIKTNLSWKNVVKNETGKNYITKLITEPSYRASDRLLDGNAWYELTGPVVAFYLDPRNFLNEENIFMFEKLTFNEEIDTSETLQKVLLGTDLNTTTRINNFVKYGKENNVSSVSAAARVIQEGVTKNSYSGLSGNSDLTYRGLSLKGYYNLFNVGAYQDSYTTNPVARGLAWACGAIGSNFSTCGTYTSYARPWNTVAKAINGGIKFLGDDYINVGQYTLYFQKFNTANSKVDGAASPYTHQYMTNVQAPLSESSTIYSLYKSLNLLDEVSFNFSIPVYTSMPEEITTLPPIGNTENNLSSLKVDGEKIAGFDSDVISYTKYISNDKNSVVIDATASDASATIEGIGTIELTESETLVQVTVISETNEEKTYTIKLIKTGANEKTVDEIIEKIDVKVNDKYLYIMDPEITSTSLLTSINKEDATATLSLTNKDKKEKNDTVLKTGDLLNIKLTTNEEKTYTIVLLGDNNGDGEIDILDLLRTQKHILNSSILSDEYLEASDTNFDNKTDIVDLLRVQKYILKSIKDFK